MPVPALEHWFSPSIRRNRKSFILAMLGVVGVMLGAYFGIRFFSRTDVAEAIYTWAFLIPTIVCTYLLTAQRLRDMNLTGWLALLWIPISLVDQNSGRWASSLALFLLAVVPGTEGPNRYGPDPLDSGDTA